METEGYVEILGSISVTEYIDNDTAPLTHYSHSHNHKELSITQREKKKEAKLKEDYIIKLCFMLFTGVFKHPALGLVFYVF